MLAPRAMAGRAAGVLLGAAVLGLAGCGSATTRRAFAARADAICASAVRAERALPPPGGAVTMATYLGEVARIVGREADALRRLPRPQQPAAQRRELRAYLTAAGTAANDFRAAASAAAAGHTAQLIAAQFALTTDRAPALAAAAGLTTCANPGGTYRSGG